MSVNLQHCLLSAAKAAEPQRRLQTAANAVILQHLPLSVTAAVDQQPLRQTAENAVNSQTCYDLARKLRLNRHPCKSNFFESLEVLEKQKKTQFMCKTCA